MRPLIRIAWVLIALRAGGSEAAPRTVYEGTLQGSRARAATWKRAPH